MKEYHSILYILVTCNIIIDEIIIKNPETYKTNYSMKDLSVILVRRTQWSNYLIFWGKQKQKQNPLISILGFHIKWNNNVWTWFIGDLWQKKNLKYYFLLAIFENLRNFRENKSILNESKT